MQENNTESKVSTSKSTDANEKNIHESRFSFNYFKKACLFALERLSTDKLTQVASSLTFTTVLAIVPMLAVILALFTAFPLFREFRESLESFFSNNLMPANISENIMSYLNKFAQQASKLTAIGSAFLVVTSIMLMITIEKALNEIWKVRRDRPFVQRILMYWTMLSLGPLMLGGSLWATTYLTREKLGLVKDVTLFGSIFLWVLPILVSAIGFILLYMIVPNRRVEWRDAIIGGSTAAILLELMKAAFAFYITRFPSYTVIYGTFATIPIFLLWIYLSWLVILFGASVAANIPLIVQRQINNSDIAGRDFTIAIQILRLLHNCRDQNPPGHSCTYISRQLNVNYPVCDDILMRLHDLALVVPTQAKPADRWVLACSSDVNILPLVNSFLINIDKTVKKHDLILAQHLPDLVNSQVKHVPLKSIL